MQSFANNPAMRSNMETQVNFMTELSQKTYDSVRKLSEINLRLAQQLMEDSLNMSRELMSCTDPFQMASTAMKQMQPATQHLRNYQQQLMGVLAGAQVDLTRVAETHIPDASRAASAMADEMVRNVSPAGGNGSAGASTYGSAHNPT
jgi:phasin family protein